MFQVDSGRSTSVGERRRPDASRRRIAGNDFWARFFGMAKSLGVPTVRAFKVRPLDTHNVRVSGFVSRPTVSVQPGLKK